jgi:hypothetical protein
MYLSKTYHAVDITLHGPLHFIQKVFQITVLPLIVTHIVSYLQISDMMTH